jgi:glycyl-tRNA synthetase beta chain
LEGRITREPGAVKQEILDYFRGRISGLLISEGHRYDTVDAVLGTAFDGLPDVRDRVEALSTFRKDPLFEPFTVVCKRAVNIIKEHRDGSVNPGLFRHDSEKVLYGEIERVEEKVGTLISKSLYQEALTEIASLRHAIDAFFDGVMVMDEDDQVRQNRLALLTRVAGLVSRIADFSKIVID